MAEKPEGPSPSSPGDGSNRRWVEDLNRIEGAPAIEETGVPQGVYLTWIKGQLDNESACLELPFTIVLMVSFSMLAILHLRQDIVLSVEGAIEFDITENANFAFSHYFGHKTIFDVHSFADYWSWLRLGFIPLVVQPTWSYSESYGDVAQSLFPTETAAVGDPQSHWSMGQYGQALGQNSQLPVRGDYLHYNRIVGGIRFRQQLGHVGQEYCKFPPTASPLLWSQWYGKPCMPAWEEIGYEPTTPDAEELADAQRVEYMLIDTMSLSDMLGMAVDMEDGCEQLERKGRTKCFCEWCASQSPPSPWLTEQTQRIEIGMITLNLEYGLLTRSLINFFFNRGSYIHKRVEVMSTWMDPFSAAWEDLIPMLACDAVWLLMLAYITVCECREIIHVLHVGEGPRWWNSLYDDYVAFWNLVDWISIIVALIVIILWSQLWMYTQDVHTTLKVLMGTSSAAIGEQAYKDLVVVFFETVETSSSQEKLFRLSLCVYPMMIMLRLFKSFAAQPRLAVVTATLVEAAQDIVHFFIVFFGCLFCLCLNSLVLFGQDLEEFGTFPRAIHSCFRMMFGDWDWEPMQYVRRSIAMVWFSMFMLLMVVILLNMLLAIIMDNYMKVKQRSMDSMTLLEQMQEMVRRRQMLKRKERVKLNDIYASFLKLEESEKSALRSKRILMPQFVLDHVSGLEMKQCRRTMTNARDAHLKASQPGFELEDMRSGGPILTHLETNTRRIRDALFYLHDRVDYYDTMRASKQNADMDAETALANAVASVTAGGVDSAVSSEVIEYITSEIARLSSEAANKLAETIKQVDNRQGYIETRQEDMVTSIRDMHHTLLNLQSEASSLTNKLRRACHEREQARSQGAQGSSWRRSMRGRVMPSCLMDCSAGDAQEAFLPKLM